jgi:hypothetical protein
MNAKRRGFFRGGICRGCRIWRGERGLTVFWIGLEWTLGCVSYNLKRMFTLKNLTVAG